MPLSRNLPQTHNAVDHGGEHKEEYEKDEDRQYRPKKLWNRKQKYYSDREDNPGKD
jgi:hypothetical protein